jgi:hypothetical protein
VSFRVQSGPAFISAGTVTATNAGLVTLVAEQAGNGTFAPAMRTRTLNAPTYAGERIGQWPCILRGDLQGVFVQGTRAYLALERAGIAILDISNPAVPVRRGGFDTSGTAVGVQVVGNLAYVADYRAGLQIIRLAPGLAQTLVFAPPASVSLSQSPLTLNATASSGLPVTFRVLSGPASVAGDRLTLTGTGAVTVRAEQADLLQFKPVALDRTINVTSLNSPPRLD